MRFLPSYLTISELLATIPGRLGRKLRHEWYSRVLARCGYGIGVEWMAVLKNRDITVGSKVWIGPFCWLSHCDIGSDVIISTGARIHSPNPYDAEPERIWVGNDVWIGQGATVMARVNQGTIVGAGAVVTRPTEPYSIVAGSPAKKIGHRG